MLLFGSTKENTLKLERLLKRLIFLRRLIGSLYSLIFTIFLFSLNSLNAAYVSILLTVLAPSVYGIALICKASKNTLQHIANASSIIFAVGNVAIIYFAQDINFIWLIIYPTTIAVYSSSTSRYKSLVLFFSIFTVFLILYPILPSYPLLVFLMTYTLVFTFSHLFSMHINIDNQTLAQLALKDSLTGLQNRRALEMKMSEESSSIEGVIFLDIDWFKKINDTHGHIFGDDVIKALGDVILKNKALSDEAYRYGGEEFVLTCKHAKSSKLSAEQIHKKVQEIEFQNGCHITVSVGVALKNANESLTELIKKADQAMYQAKQTGRNQIVFATELEALYLNKRES